MSRDWLAFWQTYRRRTGTLTWRLATSNDLQAVRRLRNITERFIGKPQRGVSLFEKPVLLALVAENEQGKIVDTVYVEMQVEIVKVAATRKGMEEGAVLEDDIEMWLRDLGFKTVWATTMNRLKGNMTPTFMRLGFKCLDGMLSVWRRRL